MLWKQGNMLRTLLVKEMNKKKFSNFIVTSVVILNILFTIAVLYVFLKVQSEPVVLIGSWFTFTTGELWLLASIKKTKVNKDLGD